MVLPPSLNHTGRSSLGENFPPEHEHFKGEENLKKPLRALETSTPLKTLNEAQMV